MGEVSVPPRGEMGKDFCPEGAVRTDAGSLFQYFTTLTENAVQPEVVAAAVSLQRSSI